MSTYEQDAEHIKEYMRQPGVGSLGRSLGIKDHEIKTSRNFAVLIEDKIQRDQYEAAMRRRAAVKPTLYGTKVG